LSLYIYSVSENNS